MTSPLLPRKNLFARLREAIFAGDLEEDSSIEALHRSKRGKVSDKWSSYLPVYDRLFAQWKHAEISMLEIGVQNGGSLETWSRYFARATHIIGCDIDEKCRALKYDDPRVKVVVGDVNALESFNGIVSACPAFDIIIDDGSHVPQDVFMTFLNYFPLVKPGGMLVIEDAHTLYHAEWQAGIAHERSCYNFFKKLADLPNYQFWQQHSSIAAHLEDYFPDGSTPQFLLDGWVLSLEFWNSIVVIRKAEQAGHDKLGARSITGTTGEVSDFRG